MMIHFFSALNKREWGYVAVRCRSGLTLARQSCLTWWYGGPAGASPLLSSGLTRAGTWGSQWMRWFAITPRCHLPLCP